MFCCPTRLGPQYEQQGLSTFHQLPAFHIPTYASYHTFILYFLNQHKSNTSTLSASSPLALPALCRISWSISSTSSRLLIDDCIHIETLEGIEFQKYNFQVWDSRTKKLTYFKRVPRISIMLIFWPIKNSDLTKIPTQPLNSNVIKPQLVCKTSKNII